MALLHSTKLTHYFAPSKSHLESFFDAVTDLYEEQEHTDLNLVTADGTAFRVHQVRARARARRCPASQFLVNWLDFSPVKYPKFDDGATQGMMQPMQRNCLRPVTQRVLIYLSRASR